jgi:acyl-CoA synthetase (AMP-forming)/AMP-acid ligase II
MASLVSGPSEMMAQEVLTCAPIAELTNHVGNCLLTLGVDLEQRVALLLGSAQFVAVFFGVIKVGAVPIPLKAGLRPGDYVYMLNDSRARALLIHASVWQQIRQILSPLKYPRYVIVDLEELLYL